MSTSCVSHGVYFASLFLLLRPAIMSSLLLGLYVSNALSDAVIVVLTQGASLYHFSKYSSWAKSLSWRAFLAFLVERDRDNLTKNDVGSNDLEQVPFCLVTH